MRLPWDAAYEAGVRRYAEGLSDTHMLKRTLRELSRVQQELHVAQREWKVKKKTLETARKRLSEQNKKLRTKIIEEKS